MNLGTTRSGGAAPTSLAALSSLAQSLATALSQAASVEREQPIPPDGDGTVQDDRTALGVKARACLRARRRRDAMFEPGLFFDPAWDMLLELFACETEGGSLVVSDACLAAAVPTSTALRWLRRLERAGAVERSPDPADARRTYVTLAPSARQAVAEWLHSEADYPTRACGSIA